MKTLLKLQEQKYLEALETIAYLKEALYCFKGFDPQKPEVSWNKVRELAFDYTDSLKSAVYVDPNSFTPWQTFLKNWCKDTCTDFVIPDKDKFEEDQ